MILPLFVFVISHVALCARTRTIVLPAPPDAPVHVQPLASYPDGPASERPYVPAANPAPLVTVGPGPDSVVGPVAVTVNADGGLPPMLSPLSTCLISVNRGAMSSFTIEQVALWPSARVI